jgi:multidrug efflux pump subunit AcrA (membrane-fusion protein)
MDVPSPSPASSRKIRVKLGDKVSEGSLVALSKPPAPQPAAAASAHRRLPTARHR